MIFYNHKTQVEKLSGSIPSYCFLESRRDANGFLNEPQAFPGFWLFFFIATFVSICKRYSQYILHDRSYLQQIITVKQSTVLPCVFCQRYTRASICTAAAGGHQARSICNFQRHLMFDRPASFKVIWPLWYLINCVILYTILLVSYVLIGLFSSSLPQLCPSCRTTGQIWHPYKITTLQCCVF